MIDINSTAEAISLSTDLTSFMFALSGLIVGTIFSYVLFINSIDWVLIMINAPFDLFFTLVFSFSVFAFIFKSIIHVIKRS